MVLEQSWFARRRLKLRRWSFFFIGLVAVLSLSGLPVAHAQSNSPFCVVSNDPIADPVQGRSYGDPHINTYDGFHYSFQTLGEYILSRSGDGAFEVQTRQGRVSGRDNLSLNTALAMNVCGDRVGLYLRDRPVQTGTPLWIDGVPTPFETDTIPLPSGGEVQQVGSGDYAIIWPSGDQVRVNSISWSGDTFYNVTTILSRRHSGNLRGLLANFNGNPNDDLTGRDGRTMPVRSTYSVATNALDRALPAAIPIQTVEDAYFSELYRQFGDSWRVRPEESLFDYGPGQTTATFTDRSFPASFLTLNGVAPAALDTAVSTCREAGVEEALLDGCIFDVAATGEPSLVNAALNAIPGARTLTNRVVDEVIDRIPLPFPF
jgi:hypothetical protein